MSEIETLKKQLIVSEDDYQKEALPELIKKLLNYCKLSSSGEVYFLKTNLPHIKKIKLILVARFLGSKLEKKINPAVSVDEFQNFLSLDRPIIQARLSDLNRVNFFNRDENGNYIIKPYQIQNVFDELSHVDLGSNYAGVKKKKNSKSRRVSRKGVPLKTTIIKLIEDNWFSDFRTVSELIKYFKTKKAQSPSVGGTQATLNRLVRKGLLERDKKKIGKKTIYSYKKRNDADHVIKE